MTWCASSLDSCLAVSALGTVNMTPDFIRFMLSSMKADGLLRYSETSIWSSDTPLGLLAAASEVSVSPGLTLTVDSPPVADDGACFSTAAGAALGAFGLRAAGAGTGAGVGASATCGAGAGAGAARGAGGAAVNTGAVAVVPGCAAVLRPGGSISSVYERVRWPVDHVKSTMTSTKGSWTTLSLVSTSTGRPSARRCSAMVAPESTEL